MYPMHLGPMHLGVRSTLHVFYGFTYWLVRREVKNKWEPLLGRLRQLLADLSAASGPQ
jgi:hypothetical protein